MSAKARIYRLSPRARQDLEEIWRYTFERWSLQQADDYYSEIIRCFVDIANGTKLGRSIGGIKPGYFALPYQSHFIVYKEDSRSIAIIRILHRRMNTAAHL